MATLERFFYCKYEGKEQNFSADLPPPPLESVHIGCLTFDQKDCSFIRGCSFITAMNGEIADVPHMNDTRENCGWKTRVQSILAPLLS